MRHAALRALAVALAIILSVLPTGLSAGDRRGPDLVVTKLDGTRVAGELIAIRPDSLLLLENGRDVSIPRSEIDIVRLVRRSRGGLWAAIGGGVGAAAGAILGLNWAFEEWTDSRGTGALYGAGIFGGAGALTGWLAGSLMGGHTTFAIADRPDAEAARTWERIGRLSREGRLTGRAAPAGARSPLPNARRFRIAVSAAYPAAEANLAAEDRYKMGSFSFPNEPAPEAGPYGAAFGLWSTTGSARIGMGPISVSYEWTPHWSIDAEFFTHGRSRCRWTGDLLFTSGTVPGDYRGQIYSGYNARFTTVLLGLSFHPVPRRLGRGHDLEIGAAAGPAWVSGTPAPETWAELFPVPSFRKLGLSGRVQAAYDHSFLPSLSLGAFAGFRFLEKRLEGTVSAASATFWIADDPLATPVFQRQTEIVFPDMDLLGGGAYFGLRVAFRI